MSKTDEEKYTFDSLDQAKLKALQVPFDLKTDRIIILSDLHKGDREKGSDDFEPNEVIYCYALRYYLKRDFKLILAGDIEEGWECDYSDIIRNYQYSAFAMEKRFVEKQKNTGTPCYFRVYGNHDNDWADPQMVKTHLWPVLGEISVYPAIFLGEKIFIVHGHQGDIYSDRGAKLSRSIVRYLWKPAQKIFKFMNTRAAKKQPYPS